MTLILIFILWFSQLTAPPNESAVIIEQPAIKPYESFLRAIIQVESQGDVNAYNPDEDARGLLQIRPIMLNEINRIVGFDKYTLQDCFDSTKSIEMFWIVQGYHNPGVNYYRGARVWNGKSKNDRYWKKVKKQL